METSRQEYLKQLKQAKEAAGILENELHEVRLKLQKDPNNAMHLKELKRINLDMTITLNELEHCQSYLDIHPVEQK